MTVGDVDVDGDYDVIAHLQSGRVRFWRNTQPAGVARPQSVRVRLDARVSNRSAVGAKVELRAGSLRDRFEVSAATPPAVPADIVFGLGYRARADVVRVLWPSGILQAEPDPARATTIVELDRKPSSCPFLFTWNGTRFEFVTDFMGGGEMGAWLAPGVRNAPDPDEYVRLGRDQLAPRNGRYELRMTNELEEALFVDRLQLVAVAHPTSVEVYPNEGLRSPAERRPFTIYTAQRPRPPVAVIDEHGHDMLDAVRAIDRRYVDDFRLEGVRGYAGPHSLTLNLGSVPAGSPLRLLFTGWTDYAFSSDNVAAHQAGLPSQPPSLEIRDADNTWRTIVPELGIPVGRPQTIAIDLTQHVPRTGGRIEVRVNTSMRVYWDRILMDTSTSAPYTVTRLDAVEAQLRWRGFSAEIASDDLGPLTYDYDRVSSREPMENDARPLHTRRRCEAARRINRRSLRRVRAWRRNRVGLRCIDASGAARRLDADVPPLRRWVQQGDEPALGEPRSARAFAISRDESLSVSRTRVLPTHARARSLSRGVQHARDWRTAAADDPQSASRRQMTHIRYAAAACQTDLPNPLHRDQMRHNTDRMIAMIQCAVDGSAPFLPVRLVVFPEFAHAAPVFTSVQELTNNLAVPIPNEHTERLAAKARELDIYIQSGTMLECDPRWPGAVFNTTCLIGPEGILYKYRKVNPWLPFEVHASPHDLEGYTEPLFPVADTPIGRIGCAICYDWLFPGSDSSARGQRRRGARARLRVHGSLGSHRTDELVDDRESMSCAGKHRVRGGGKPGSELAALSAVFVAGRQPDRRFRRAAARRGVARTWRADCRRADRHLGAAARAEHAHGPPDARASAHGSVSRVSRAPLSAAVTRLISRLARGHSARTRRTCTSAPSRLRRACSSANP